jgi:cell division protease FtsH
MIKLAQVPAREPFLKVCHPASREIDTAVHKILDEQYARAKEIIMKHREVLEEGAQLLLKKEKISGQELKALMEKSP